VNLAQLTVIVPTRNEAHNIPTFLRSLPPEVALIGVDASQDDTAEMMMAFRPDQTLVIRHSSRITEARQMGAEAARTPWLLFTDADVVFAPDYFEHLLTYQNYEAIYGPKLSRDDFISYYRWFGRGSFRLEFAGQPPGFQRGGRF
jgi:glycosyltransferase involved in cell wall biosynthesis